MLTSIDVESTVSSSSTIPMTAASRPNPFSTNVPPIVRLLRDIVGRSEFCWIMKLRVVAFPALPAISAGAMCTVYVPSEYPAVSRLYDHTLVPESSVHVVTSAGGVTPESPNQRYTAVSVLLSVAFPLTAIVPFTLLPAVGRSITADGSRVSMMTCLSSNAVLPNWSVVRT